MRAAKTLAFALGAGLVTGLLEMAPLAWAMERGEPLRVSRQIAWMAPVADGVLFVAVAAALLLVGRAWSRAASPAAVVGALAGLAALALLLLIEPLHDLAALMLAAGIGVQTGRVTAGERAERAVRAGPVVAAAAAVVVAGVAGWSLTRPDREEDAALAALPAAAEGRPNVLLLILDTVRAQSVGRWALEGDDPNATPRIDALAARGVAFERAVATAPWTLPSHASMFTGRWPWELGADWLRPLDDRAPTLAEVLAGEGYATAGFVGNLLYASSETGLGRGFHRYEDYPVGPGQVVLSSSIGRALAFSETFRGLVGHHDLLNRKDAETVNGQFLDWLADDAPDGRPWFAFLNYYDAHEPLFPHDSLGMGDVDYSHRGGVRVGGNAWLTDKWRLSRDQVDAYAASYHGAIADLDARVGALLDALEARGELDNTLIVLASDHGEQLGEHGLFAHNNSLYMTAVHVPLAMVLPDRLPAGATVDASVSLRDLPATILDVVGAGGSLPGTSLAGLWAGADGSAASGSAASGSLASGSLAPGSLAESTPRGSDAAEEGDAEEGGAAASPAISFLTRGYVDQPDTPLGNGLEMQSMLRGPWHYVHNGDGSDALFHVGVDPRERTNLAGSPRPDSVLVEIRSVLYEAVTGRPAPEGLPVKPAEGRGPGPGPNGGLPGVERE